MGAPTVVILVPGRHGGDWPLQLLSQLGGHPLADEPGTWQADARTHAHACVDYLVIRRYEEFRREQEPEHIAMWLRRVPEPELFILYGRASKAVAAYINLLPDEKGILIESEHGWLDTVGNFKAAVAQGLDWNYTEVSPGP